MEHWDEGWCYPVLWTCFNNQESRRWFPLTPNTCRHASLPTKLVNYWQLVWILNINQFLQISQDRRGSPRHKIQIVAIILLCFDCCWWVFTWLIISIHWWFLEKTFRQYEVLVVILINFSLSNSWPMTIVDDSRSFVKIWESEVQNQTN